jgi:hypothetical protein
MSTQATIGSDLDTAASAETVARAKAARDEAAALARWQARLLPFMSAGLAAAGLFFSVATWWFFSDLQRRLDYTPTDVVAVVAALPKAANLQDDGASYRDWYTRVVLEGMARQERFNMQATIVKGSLWTRFMGFLTGMLLALTGCIFVLGQLRADVNASGEGEGFKGQLATNSPGVYLATLGTIIIAVSVFVQASVELNDKIVYLQGEAASVRQPPSPMLPTTSTRESAATEGTTTNEVPPVPPSVLDTARMQAEGVR